MYVHICIKLSMIANIITLDVKQGQMVVHKNLSYG